jgi:hypothetical protein
MISATPIDVDNGGCGRALLLHPGEDPNREHRGGDRSSSQEPGDAPVDIAVLVVDRGASGFRHRGVEQIGSHGRERMHAEEEYQQRRHQRPATHAGETDDGADDNPERG